MQKRRYPSLKPTGKRTTYLLYLLLSIFSFSARSQPIISPVHQIPLNRVDEVVYIHDSLSYMVDNYMDPIKHISVSSDNWKTWKNLWLNHGLVEVASMDTLYIVKNGIYRSDNFGGDWKLMPGTRMAEEGRLTNYLDIEYHQGILLATFLGADNHVKVLYSQDAGDSHTILDVAETTGSNNRWKIKAESATKWWIFADNGNMFRYTEDAGQTWQSIPYQITGTELVVLPENKLAFVQEGWEVNFGLTGRNGAISSDGGGSWTSLDYMLFPLTDSIYVTSIDGHSINYTLNGGQPQTGKEFDFYDLGWFGEVKNVYLIHSTGEIYAVFSTGQVIKSEDTLKTFTAVTDEVIGLTDATFYGETGLGRNGSNYNFAQNLYLTENGGSNWDQLPLPEGYFLGNYYLRHPDTISVVMVTNDDNFTPRIQIYETYDKGQTYQEVQSSLTNNQNISTYRTKHTQDQSYVFFRADDSLLILPDNGSSWLAGAPDEMEDFYFYDKSNGVILNHPNNLSTTRELYITNDMGQSWDTSSVELTTNGYQSTVFMNSQGDIFARNNGMGWVRTRDKGLSWDSVLVFDSPSIAKYCHMVQTGKDTLVVYYQYGLDFIYSSTDNGDTWEKNAAWALDYYNGRFRKYELISYDRYGVSLNEHAVIENIGNCDGSPEIIQTDNSLNLTESYALIQWSVPGNLSNYPELNRLTETMEIAEKGRYRVQTVDENGCPGYAEYQVTDITSTLTMQDIDINLYPVPATGGVLHINYPDQKVLSVQIFDISGQEVSNLGKDYSSLDVSGLSNGVYIVKIHTSGGEIAKRVVIMN